MLKENLEYWYDENGNKVYGNKKHYNKKLEYLLSDNPEEVISQTGLEIRKMINPIFRNVVQLTTKNTFHIERDSDFPKDRPIIFASTHGFRDDVALAIKAAGTHSYLLYGSIPDFYYSIDGIALWANGTVIVDRKDKNSRASSINKMSRVIELGGNILMFPEGVWNKSENKLVLNLFPGIYRLAKKNNAIIVPIASIQSGDNCYAKRMKPLDIIKYDEIEGLKRLRDELATGKLELMMKHTKMERSNVDDNYWQAFLEKLISTSNGLYDYEIENSAEYIDKSIIDEKEVFDVVDNIHVNTGNAFVFAKTSNICRKNKF